MSSQMESARAAHEAVETIEKAISKFLLEKDAAGGGVKAGVSADQCIDTLIREMQSQATNATDM